MKIKRNLLLLAALLFTIINQSNAHIISASKWYLTASSGKLVEIIVLGDYHLAGQPGADHIKILKSKFLSWLKGNKKTLIMIEGTKKQKNEYKTKEELVCGDLIMHIRAALLNPADPIYELWCDIRDEISLGELCLTLLHYCKTVSKSPNISLDFSSIDLKPLSAHTALDEIKTVLYKLRFIKTVYEDSFGLDSIEYTVITNYINKIQTIYEKTTLFFKQYLNNNLNQPCLQAFENFLAEHSHDALIKLLDHICFSDGQLIADIGFITALIGTTENNSGIEYDRIVFFGGNLHAIELNNFLSEYIKQNKSMLVNQKGCLNNAMRRTELTNKEITELLDS